jgi:hypothetical protein
MSDEKKEDAKVSNGTAAKIKGLEEKINKVISWLEIKHGRDVDDDGKIGNVRVAAVLIILCAVAAFGNLIKYPTASGGTGFEVDTSGNGTFGGTCTASSFSGAITGDITADDINMSGGVSDTLGFNATKAASVTGLAVTVKNDIAGTAIDTDYLNTIGLQMNNDSSEDIDWQYEYIVIDDNTTNTEDSAWEMYLQVGGTATKVLDANASGLTVVGDVSGTTLSGGEATIDSKYAVTGGDATTGLMVQHAAITAGAVTTTTNTFAVAFASGTTPSVMLTYTEDPGTTNNLYSTSVASNQVVVVHANSKNYSYVAVGTRP